MTNLTPEVIAKAKAAKNENELLEIAKENGIELTEEEAKIFFEQLNANGAVADNELSAVAGGLDCPKSEEESIPENTRVKFLNGVTCLNCGCAYGYVSYRAATWSRVALKCVKCEDCQKAVYSKLDLDLVELV